MMADHLQLRDRGLLRLEEWGIMKSRTGRYPMAGPCDLSDDGRGRLREEVAVIAGPGNPSGVRDPYPGRILVVDDEPAVRRTVRRILDEEGYHVLEAGNGAEALELVRAAPDRLDLVVSDVAMPRLNGVQLLEALAMETPELPCILISGYTPPELDRLGISPPCGMLPKPLIIPTFLEEVRRCMRQRN